MEIWLPSDLVGIASLVCNFRGGGVDGTNHGRVKAREFQIAEPDQKWVNIHRMAPDAARSARERGCAGAGERLKHELPWPRVLQQFAHKAQRIGRCQAKPTVPPQGHVASERKMITTAKPVDAMAAQNRLSEKVRVHRSNPSKTASVSALMIFELRRKKPARS